MKTNLLFIFIFCCVTTVCLSQNLIKNGSFEIFTVDPGPDYTTLYPGSAVLTNWNIINGTVDHKSGRWPAFEGSKSVDLNGVDAGTLTQSFQTDIDSVYALTFMLAGNPFPPEVKMVKVTVGDFEGEFTFDITGKTNANIGWIKKEINFKAISSISTLTFTSFSSGNAGPAIDDVKIFYDKDCAGTKSGKAILDSCGICLIPEDPLFNKSCVDCLGQLKGNAIIDSCGVCNNKTSENFNKSCADCSGVPNGLAIVDSCGLCLLKENPLFNKSCLDCFGKLNGLAILDKCGVCLLPNDPQFNKVCADCLGTPNGLNLIDSCGICLNPTDPKFGRSCAIEGEIVIPNIFSPNGDGKNDFFKIFYLAKNNAKVLDYIVFDRWGNMVYQNKNFGFDSEQSWWNGESQNKIIQGVYTYLIEVEFETGFSRKYFGSITLIL